ncbi:MAG: DUF2278 family protein [bacterium]|nr:DUF2278 family protein [bacterium]
MSLKNYSVLKGTVADTQAERDDDTPHFQIMVAAGDVSHRIAVNVMSAAQPSELKYIVVDNLQHALTEGLKELADGLHPLESRPGQVALDYLRGNLFDVEQMKVIPHDAPGPDNDLNDLCTMYTERSRRQETARIYAFGETWGPEENADKHFGFVPGRGIHDIHMNQGNGGRWRQDNGIYQDGGLILHFPDQDQWVGVFLAFQNQALHTDERGHPLDITPPVVGQTMRIVAALPNPHGHDRRNETVTLINLSDQAVNLDGWKLRDHQSRVEPLPAQELPAGECLRITLTGSGAILANKGGQLSLLTPDGVKVHGVSYTKKQGKTSGWTVAF